MRTPEPRAPGEREPRTRSAWLIDFAPIVVVLVAILAVVLTSGSGSRASARPDGRAGPSAITGRPPRLSGPPAHAEVALASTPGGRTVPRSFFGVSTEYWTLPFYEHQIRTFERVLALLHVRGDGPLVLRIGGDSVDHVYWQLRTPGMPGHVFALTRGWLRSIASMVKWARLRLILDMNLVADSPQMAARWAHAALHALPPGSVLGFEIGNEPDLPHRFSHRVWRKIARHLRLTTVPLPEADNLRSYAQDFPRYALALKRAAPHVALLGPALGNPDQDLNWLTHFISVERGLLGIMSAHRYALSACMKSNSPRYPTVARLLSDRTSAGLASSASRAVALAHRAGLSFRLTEVNSVTCGGRAGVSNTFATALWAPDALFELLRSGVDAVNLHVRAAAINAPFGITADGLHPRPLLYGLILFVRALGRDARLIPLSLHAPRGLNLKAWAVRLSDRSIHVLLIDKDARPVSVKLGGPGRGPATVERLLAGSPTATSGVTLAGQSIGGDGRWQGRRVLETVSHGRGGYAVTLPAFSAALVSFGG